MALAPPPLDPSKFPKGGCPTDADVVFATFFVSPGIDPNDYRSLRPDMRFARVLRQSHAHLKVHVAVLTDSATKLGGLGAEQEEEGGDDNNNETETTTTEVARREPPRSRSSAAGAWSARAWAGTATATTRR